MKRKHPLLIPILAVAALAAGALHADAATNGEKCAAAKMKAAAKYASCRLAADAKAKSTGDPADYTKCTDGQSASWTKIEDKYGADCLTSGDQASIQSDLTDSTQCVTDLLAGDPGSCTTVQDPPCPGGTVIDATCWMVSAVSDNCTSACASQGLAYNTATATVAGNTADIGKCLYVASKLGFPKAGNFGGGGPPDIGCGLSGGQPYLSSASTPTGSYPFFQRICACQ